MNLLKVTKPEDSADAVLLCQRIAGSEAVDENTTRGTWVEANAQGAIVARMTESWGKHLIPGNLAAKRSGQDVKISHRPPP